MFVTPYYYCCCCTINSTHSHGKGINHTHTAGSAAVSRVALLSLPFEYRALLSWSMELYLSILCICKSPVLFYLYFCGERLLLLSRRRCFLPHATYQYSCPAVRYTVVRTYSSTYFAALHHESLGIFKSRPLAPHRGPLLPLSLHERSRRHQPPSEGSVAFFPIVFRVGR